MYTHAHAHTHTQIIQSELLEPLVSTVLELENNLSAYFEKRKNVQEVSSTNYLHTACTCI